MQTETEFINRVYNEGNEKSRDLISNYKKYQVLQLSRFRTDVLHLEIAPETVNSIRQILIESKLNYLKRKKEGS